MKEATMHSLLIGRTLLDEAIPLCSSVDRYRASAGISILQDALEIFFLALLIEIGVDEQKALESKSFDELIGELRKAGVPVPKSGTLKALNKQRVLTKHYAQVAEPTTVKGYLDTAVAAVEAALAHVTGRSLSGILLTEILDSCESKDLLVGAERLIGQGDFLSALIEIRKAIYLSFESDYDIQGWKDVEDKPLVYGLLGIVRGGRKALHWTRNKKWIDVNVHKPTDFVQLDHEQWRVDAMEKGIAAVELHNLRRLTPAVVRMQSSKDWFVEYGVHFAVNNANYGNAQYCLDRAVATVIKLQQHEREHRHTKRDAFGEWPEFFLGDNVYVKASVLSPVVHIVNDEYDYSFGSILTGLSGIEKFVEISGSFKPAAGQVPAVGSWISGFIVVRENALPQ